MKRPIPGQYYKLNKIDHIRFYIDGQIGIIFKKKKDNYNIYALYTNNNEKQHLVEITEIIKHLKQWGIESEEHL